MNQIVSILNPFFSLPSSFLKRSFPVKIGILLILLIAAWFGIPRVLSSRQAQQRYQTTTAQKGTLVVSVSSSGQVSSINSASVTTNATGVVKKIYIQNGQKVRSTTPIAEIELDLKGKQNAVSALASYQSAKNTLESAKANFYSLQSDMFTNWDAYMKIAQSSTYQNSDGSAKNDQRQLPQFMISNDDWLATEAKYKNQQAVVAQAQTALNYAWLSYQLASSVVYAPISGTLTGFSLQVGSVIGSTSGLSTSSTTTTSSQKIGSVVTEGKPAVTINLTEIDAPKVKIGNKATITLDAFTGKTFTGKVVSIDTVGVVNSGVTTYPTVIQLDLSNPQIYSNMSAQANIITQTADDVLLVPVVAVQTQDGQSVVRVMQGDKEEQVAVETGLSSDTQIEIKSGLAEGDIIITGVNGSGGRQTTQTQSPFSPFGTGGFRGGGNVRINR